MRANFTPVPNLVFDVHLKDLKNTELKILLIVIRQTLGWENRKNKIERKECDWISGSQLVGKTGSSNRAVNSAIQILVEKKLIEVLDGSGIILDTPEKRRGKSKLFYRLSSANFADVDTEGKGSGYQLNISPAYANFAEDFRKKRRELTQKLRYTKETLQKKFLQKSY